MSENVELPDISTRKKKSSSRRYQQQAPAEYMVPETDDVGSGDMTTIKMFDILPLVLCIGILVLLYFFIREFQAEQENHETQFMSIMKRLDGLESKKGTPVPPAEKASAGKTTDKDVVEPTKDGTYVMKDDVISYKPDDSLEQIDESGSEIVDSETDEEV